MYEKFKISEKAFKEFKMDLQDVRNVNELDEVLNDWFEIIPEPVTEEVDKAA